MIERNLNACREKVDEGDDDKGVVVRSLLIFDKSDRSMTLYNCTLTIIILIIVTVIITFDVMIIVARHYRE